MQYPDRVNIIDLAPAPFNNARAAIAYAKSHGIVGLMSDTDTGGKGEVSISVLSIRKMMNQSALRKSVTPALHYAALVRLRDIIRESFIAEIHQDRVKRNGKRSTDFGTNPEVTILRLYGCVAFGDIPFRSKVTLKAYADANEKTKAYSYEITNVEVLKGNAGAVPLPSDKTSTFATDILLNGVCDVNGDPLLKMV